MGISHLFFANDLMLFGEATKHQATIIMDCLKRFSKVSGLEINLGKSQIFCSSNTHDEVKRKIREITRIPITSRLGRYLGVPILQRRVSKQNFMYILDNMRWKLANWQTYPCSICVVNSSYLHDAVFGSTYRDL